MPQAIFSSGKADAKLPGDQHLVNISVSNQLNVAAEDNSHRLAADSDTFKTSTTQLH